ncbi:hypothetical protein GWK47_050643 [Chionoecetes opilio]|uniref:Uncharacterized protein n=1 Tax=Chionoecetes opilio TaxID=41210 RepID=A0A8J5CDH5_CHIOP|nr:hypothetical protein GWK47_050643 [Chionoecetes opilio]
MENHNENYSPRRSIHFKIWPVGSRTITERSPGKTRPGPPSSPSIPLQALSSLAAHIATYNDNFFRKCNIPSELIWNINYVNHAHFAIIQFTSRKVSSSTLCLSLSIPFSSVLPRCHSITSVSGVGFDSLHDWPPTLHFVLFILRVCEGRAAVKMFHILETRPNKGALVLTARERGTPTASPRVSTVLVLRVAFLGGCSNPAKCGTPGHLCLCEYHKRHDVPAVFRVSREDTPARTGLVGLGGLQHPPVAGPTLMLSPPSGEAAHDLQERARTLNKAVSGLCRARASLPCRGSWLPFAGQRPCERPF